jgi:hypothetical protein
MPTEITFLVSLVVCAASAGGLLVLASARRPAALAVRSDGRTVPVPPDSRD